MFGRFSANGRFARCGLFKSVPFLPSGGIRTTLGALCDVRRSSFYFPYRSLLSLEVWKQLPVITPRRGALSENKEHGYVSVSSRSPPTPRRVGSGYSFHFTVLFFYPFTDPSWRSDEVKRSCGSVESCPGDAGSVLFALTLETPSMTPPDLWRVCRVSQVLL